MCRLREKNKKMEAEEIEKFTEYMRINTDIAESSIRLYSRTISRFLFNYHVVTIETMNEFISDSFRKSRSNYVKYAFKYYLDFKHPKKKSKSIYDELVKVKGRSKKRLGNFHDKDTIHKIINNIGREKFRDMCKLQYALGARAREIITLRAEYIEHYYKDDTIRITIIGKGDKERTLYLNSKYRQLLKKYQKTDTGFLFLDSRYNYADEPELEVAINTMRQYLYEALNNSVEEFGIRNFGTHDLRRNLAEQIYQKTKDIYLIKEILGHSKIDTTEEYFDKMKVKKEEALAEHQKG